MKVSSYEWKLKFTDEIVKFKDLSVHIKIKRC